ncbi:MAG: hypothetical protein JWO58_859 [Chitinophagaceae bacterium]|nr:hypothetical protein [Chitinophagaceae bacterium]
MNTFFTNFDWNSFWMNILVGLIFLMISIPIAIKVIPYYILKLIKARNKKYIVRKLSYLMMEICEYLNESPYEDEELNQEELAISTSKQDLKTYRFINLVDLNVFNQMVRLKIHPVILDHYTKLNPDESFQQLIAERDRLRSFRTLLENIIDIPALYPGDEILSEVSELCLDIRSFEISFKYNNSMEDLLLSDLAKRNHHLEIGELADIYKKIIHVLHKLLEQNYFEVEITKNI